MGPSYIKMILREFKKSIGRFAAIFGIVALGVGILSGLFITTPDMHESVDQYYDQHDTADIFIKGTMGLTDSDLDELGKEKNVKDIMPAYVIDKIIDLNGKENLTAKIYGIPLIDSEDDVHINKLELIKGRMPKNKRECLVERSSPFIKDIKIGDKIKISDENEDYEDIDDIYASTEYEVVGIVGNSFHFGMERESSNVGSGKLDTIIYVDKSTYALDEYTDFYIVLDDTKEMNTFSSEYEDYSEENRKQIESLGEERSVRRKKDILDEANSELEDGYEEYYEEKEKAESELSDALIDINDGKAELQTAAKEIEDGEKELKDARATLKKENSKALNEIESAEKKLEDARAELNDSQIKLNKAADELDSGRNKYNEGYNEYNKNRDEVNKNIDMLAEAQEEIYKNENEIIVGIEQVQAGKAELQNGIAQIEQALQSEDLSEEERVGLESNLNQYKAQLGQLNTQEAELDAGLDQIRQAKKELAPQEAALDAAVGELNKAADEIEASRVKLENGQAEYETGLAAYESGKQEYENGVSELQNARETLKSETKKANQKIKDAEKELADGKVEYQDGAQEIKEAEEDYAEGKAEADEELDEAYQDLLEAEEEIKDIEDPEWYVLDRNSNMSYVSFKLNSDKVDAISKVFPIFFYLVAGLVALTTMTRMIEEERTQIGVLKALGYSKSTIIAKYILYCGLASLLGSIVGQLVGFEVIPRVIWDAYGAMYHLPKFVIDYNKRIAVLSSGVAILSTVVATYFAASNSLREKPALLMLPKPPKEGKRILLEKIKPLWSRLSFNMKSTARNIFRYKKHFYMTVIGVSGCTALLVTGFGLRNSFQDLGIKQFDEIFKYQLSIQLEEEHSQDNADRISSDFEEVKDTMELYLDEGDLKYDGKSEDITLVGVDEEDIFSDYILFRDRKTDKNIEYSKDKVVITEKIAEELDIKAGDKVVFKNSDEIDSEFTIDAITENYIGNFIYVDKANYENLVGKDLDNNTIYAKTQDLKSDEEDKLIEDFYQNEDVLNAEFISQRRGIFDNLINSIDYVVIVIIVASGLLAFIVLYNLTNININERNRELATLKVLGFHDNEVASYILREITILAIIGTLVGLLLGKFLHYFIIINIEDPDFMFGRDIKAMSYILSAIITMIFSAIVDLFMLKKLKNIEMVDSMKAND